MRTRAFVLASIVLTASPAGAQDRAAQIATGSALAGLGAVAALAGMECGQGTWQTAGRCLHLRGQDAGPAKLSAAQMAGGLAASGVGAAMAAGLWEPSRGLDATVTAAVGAGLLLGAFNYDEAPGTIRGDFGGRRFSVCRDPDFADTITDRCTTATLARQGMMWAGALGLAAVRMDFPARLGASTLGLGCRSADRVAADQQSAGYCTTQGDVPQARERRLRGQEAVEQAADPSGLAGPPR